MITTISSRPNSASEWPWGFSKSNASLRRALRLRAAGAGLGLALVNRFVELHRGWVESESQPGAGTRVTCHLPRKAEGQDRGSEKARA